MSPDLARLFDALETGTRALLGHVAGQPALSPQEAAAIHQRMRRVAKLLQSTHELLALAVEDPLPQLVAEVEPRSG